MIPTVKSVQSQLLSRLQTNVVMSSLYFFGKTELTNEIISNAETFLLKCISDEKLDKFDDVRYELYHKKKKSHK